MATRKFHFALFVMLFTLRLVCVGQAQEPQSEVTPDAAVIDHFEQHVRPILVTKCLQCHSGKKPKGQLRLDSRQSLLEGGESGPAIVPHQADESLLVSALRYDSFEMPPDNPLLNSEISEIEQWIETGAAWPANATLTAAAPTDRQITAADREHWSFQPISNPQVPRASEDAWSRNPIDRFVYHRLQATGIAPAPEADRRTLVRRVFFDLLGLPPNRQQVERFVNDTSETAFEDLVDRLLSNPAYGERWGRHWLDLVRYGESDGYRADAYRPNAWRYRDYVIASFNDDKPYDRFIREQLAGDELYPDDPAAWVGTGFLRLHLYEYNQRDVITQRQDILNDVTDVTADVFLGLGMKCARCHDHKFDPILQLDYFRIQSHFAAMMPRDDVPLVTPAELETYQQQQDDWLAATQSIRDEIAAIRRPYEDKRAQAVLVKFTPDIKRIFSIPPAERSPLEQQLMYFVDRQANEEGSATPSKEDAKRIENLEKRLGQFDHLKPAALPRAESITDTGQVAPPTEIPGRPDAALVEPGAVEVICHLSPTVPPAAFHRQTTGRRAALADWLTSPTNPLTSRVAMNRVWQYHFGRGLVKTPSDFGKLGTEPSHPGLLDWLATQFRQDGWSWKAMHRLMVTSATYRQSAHHPDASAMDKTDPENRLRWRWDVRRLSAEQIFDALLSVSGQLDLSVGGASESGDSRRRAIYRQIFRNKSDTLLGLFDVPDGINSMPSRPVTTTPTQALALLNSAWATKTAAAMAQRLVAECDEDQARAIGLAYELAFARSPTEGEVALAAEFLGDAVVDVESLTDFCHVLLNSNEFVYLD